MSNIQYKLSGIENSVYLLQYLVKVIINLLICHRYHLKGPKKGQVDTFVENLPGLLDNIRPSSGGGYWLCDALPRGPGFSLFDFLAPRPLIRKLLTQVLWTVDSTQPSVDVIIKYYILNNHYHRELCNVLKKKPE